MDWPSPVKKIKTTEKEIKRMQAPSSSTISGVTSSTFADNRETIDNNSTPRSKRTMMTGHRVAQLPEATRLSPVHQQSEQPTTSTLHQGAVTESQTLPVSSFSVAAAAIPEPMELSTASDEIPIDAVIAKFLPRHQMEIRECLNDSDREKLLTKVARFLKTLENRGIELSNGTGQPPTSTLFSQLEYCNITEDTPTILGFFDCANAFFSAVDNTRIENTSCLSSMLNSRNHMVEFAAQNENNLRLLADNPHLEQITSMCARQGVPDPMHAAAMVEWECWKTDGIFNHELFRIFAAMRSGQGLFGHEAEVRAIMAWPCWRVDGEFSMDSLRTIFPILRRKGLPRKAEVDAFLAWADKVDSKLSLERLRIY